jgi:hypothetical protein
VYRVAWSADSRMLVSASKDSTLKVSCSDRTDLYILQPRDRATYQSAKLTVLSSGIYGHTRSGSTFPGIRTRSTVSTLWQTRSSVADVTRLSRCELAHMVVTRVELTVS